MDRRRLNVVDFGDFVCTESVFTYWMEKVSPAASVTAFKIEKEKKISQHKGSGCCELIGYKPDFLVQKNVCTSHDLAKSKR